MSVTEFYKTVTFKSRTAVTVESALMDYIMNQAKFLNMIPAGHQGAEITKKNIERAEEALVALRAGALSEGMKS